MLEIKNFDDNLRFESSIKREELIVRFSPIQYKTDTQEALITETAEVELNITLPVYISDMDRDGLPDYWERVYELDYESPNSENGPNGDPDNDKATNMQEFIDFTNPIVNEEL